MSHLLRPATKVVVVPREGEIEITLNIHVTVDGQVQASSDQADVLTAQQKPQEPEKTRYVIPDFGNLPKLNFGKKGE